MSYLYRDDVLFYNQNSYPEPCKMNFEVHMHDVCEMIYLLEGDVSAVIGEKTYKLKKHSLVFFRANIPHRIRIDGEGVYERFDVLFDENKFANGIFMKLPTELDVIDCAGHTVILDLFRKLIHYTSCFSGEDLTLIVHSVFHELIYNIYRLKDTSMDTRILTVNPLISSAVQFIKENFHRDIGIEDICKHLNITKSYLHRLFSEEMQMSPKKYVNICRLAHAQRLIRDGAKPSHVYLECGYSEYATFFRNYLSYFGYKPSQECYIEIERNIYS